MTANVATRLLQLVHQAQTYGAGRLTSPSSEIWSAVFMINKGRPDELFEAVAAVHRNIRRLRRVVNLANPRLFTDSSRDLDNLSRAFELSRLETPWNNTRQLLNDRVQLSLTACGAALDGRFDELEFSDERIRYIESLLTQFAARLDDEAIPDNLRSYLSNVISEVAHAVRKLDKLGPEEFARVTDHVLANLDRALLVEDDVPPESRRVLRALGVTIASATAAVTLGLGALDLDQKTVQILPWSGKVDQAVVKCVIDPPVPSSQPALNDSECNADDTRQ